MSGYEAGYCNIGRRQRRRRLTVSAGAFGVAVLYVLAYLVGSVPSPLLVAVFIPLSVGFEWGLQAYTSFCVRLALLNRYDFRGDGGESGTVTDRGARRADQWQAARITGAALALAAATTGVLVLALG